MASIIGVIKELYIRLMVWLGAAPPTDYEYLVHKEAGGPQEYNVKPGDTLFSIARKFGVHYDLIAKANNLTDPPSLQSGQKITVPQPGWQPPAETVAEPKAEPAVEPTPTPVVERPIEPTPAPVVEERPIKPPLPLPWEEAEPQPPAAEAIAPPPPPPTAPVETPAEVVVAPELAPTLTEVVPPRPAEAEMVFRYTVQRGDTISSIARKYGLTIKDLIEANDIVNPNLIFPGQKLIIPGYLAEEVAELAPEPTPAPRLKLAIGLEPGFPPLGPADAIRGLYVSYFAIGHPETRQRILELLETTEFNAVIIDAKGDDGLLSYPTQIPLAHKIGAAHPTTKDLATMLVQLKNGGIYTIARVVTFKDTPLAKSYPEYAVKTAAGNIWFDRDQQGWADPFLKPVWDYNIQIAIEAAQMGFDEIQFDYVRFPLPGQAGSPQFSQQVSRETRVAAVTGFLSAAQGQLKPLGIKLGAGIFGYACWRKDDTLIGQDIDRMGPYLDVLSPMLYPSTFGNGIPGYKNPVAHPYEVVHESTRRAVARTARYNCTLRPWLQDFPDYRFDQRVYGRDEIQTQIRASFDAGSSGFMIWNPHTNYTNGAYAPVKR